MVSDGCIVLLLSLAYTGLFLPDFRFSHDITEDSSLMRCYTVLLGEWYLEFWRIVMPASSGSGKEICHLTSMLKPVWSFDTSGTIHPVTHYHITGDLNIQTSVCLSRPRLSVPYSNTDWYICLHPLVPLLFQPSISLVVQILFRSPVIVICCISLLLAFIQGPCGHFCLSVVQNELFVPWKFKWKLSGLLYECIVLLCSFNTFSRWLCSCVWCPVAWQQGTWWQ